MVSARTALLLVLRQGPGYGRDLARRIQDVTAGRKRFAEGSIYPALRGLEAARLVRSFKVVPGRRRGGRARTYYELTERGVRDSGTERACLLRLVAGATPPVPGPGERDRMRQRMDLGADLSEAALVLAVRAAPRRGRVA
jgi:DNA-binding PadR family transcriptional regulator